jgi:hypothetical protein
LTLPGEQQSIPVIEAKAEPHEKTAEAENGNAEYPQAKKPEGDPDVQ